MNDNLGTKQQKEPELMGSELDGIVGGGALLTVSNWITSIYAPEVPAIRAMLPQIKITVQ